MVRPGELFGDSCLWSLNATGWALATFVPANSIDTHDRGWYLREALVGVLPTATIEFKDIEQAPNPGRLAGSVLPRWGG